MIFLRHVDIVSNFLPLSRFLSLVFRLPSSESGASPLVSQSSSPWLVSFFIADSTTEKILTVHPDFVLNKWDWLAHIGRLPRSKKNEKLENFIAELQRLTIHHERGETGDDYYRFGGSETQKEDDSEHKSKGSSAKNKEGKAKKDDKSGGEGGGSSAEGEQSGQGQDRDANAQSAGQEQKEPQASQS